MASAVSTFSVPILNSQLRISSSQLFCIPFKKLHSQSPVSPNPFNSLKLNKTNSFSHGIRKLRSVEEDTQIPGEEVQVQEGTEQPAVSVPVSPSDTLTMFFQAEGTMNDTAIPTVTKALEETDGIADLKVQVQEGIASVELTKQTTVQATGVASSLVELIQGSGFKLQTLNLSFVDEEDVLVQGM